MTKKEFALAQIAPYFKNPKTCAVDELTGKCMYLAKDGKMCIAGKNLIDPKKWNFSSSISVLIGTYGEEIFKPEARGILSREEWSNLQILHDAIAFNLRNRDVRDLCKSQLFTYDEMVEAADKLS